MPFDVTKCSNVLKMAVIAGFMSLVSIAQVSATPARADFDKRLTFSQGEEPVTLDLTGFSKRKIMFFKVYSVAHYASSHMRVDSSSDDLYQSILNAPGPKQISIVFDRDLDAEKVQKTLTKGVNKNCVGDEFVQVQDALEKFKSVINKDVKKNDEFALRWLPDGRLLSLYHDEVVGEVQSPLLARLLWKIWFGDHAVVDRADMVQNLTNENT